MLKSWRTGRIILLGVFLFVWTGFLRRSYSVVQVGLKLWEFFYPNAGIMGGPSHCNPITHGDSIGRCVLLSNLIWQWAFRFGMSVHKELLYTQRALLCEDIVRMRHHKHVGFTTHQIHSWLDLGLLWTVRNKLLLSVSYSVYP